MNKRYVSFLQKWLILLVTMLTASLMSSAMASQTPHNNFTQLTNEYFDTIYLPFNPTLATQLGVHQYDDQLEDYSKVGMDAKIKRFQAFAKRVEAVNPAQLDEQQQGNRELILNSIRSQLLTLQKIRPWEKNPDYYISGTPNSIVPTGIANSAFVIMEREYAPVNDRLRAFVAREKRMPAVLSNAKKNLRNPPKIFTDIAIEQLPGIISFFQKDVPMAFDEATDPVLKKEFVKSNAAVIASLQSFQAWLKHDLLPRSHGDFRIGADAFSKKLQYDEMVDLPLDQLLAIGWANLRENQRAYDQLIKKLGHGKSSSQVKVMVDADHPASNQLLNTFSSTFNDLTAFINKNNIITIPSSVPPVMEETPPFMRATTLASMDTPGPFETGAGRAYFNVTLPNAEWSKAKQADYMSTFNYAAINDTVIHETYPGHYVQLLWVHQLPDRVRKTLHTTSNLEGWAHYCEQMMLDEGFGKELDAQKRDMLRLGQLQGALLRNARFIVGIQMHTGKMTPEQSAAFFVKEGRQSKTVALVEVKRGTGDPTYLYYTLGKLLIQKLRADVQAKEGSAFNLKKFHDDFMSQGAPPIKLVRKALLKDDSPVL